VSESLLVQLRKGVLDLCVPPCSSVGTICLRHRQAVWPRRSAWVRHDLSLDAAHADRRSREDYLEESSSGPPRKYYQLTKAGHAALAAQKAEWNVIHRVRGQGAVGRIRIAAPAAKIAGGVK